MKDRGGRAPTAGERRESAIDECMFARARLAVWSRKLRWTNAYGRYSKTQTCKVVGYSICWVWMLRGRGRRDSPQTLCHLWFIKCLRSSSVKLVQTPQKAERSCQRLRFTYARTSSSSGQSFRTPRSFSEGLLTS